MHVSFTFRRAVRSRHVRPDVVCNGLVQHRILRWKKQAKQFGKKRSPRRNFPAMQFIDDAHYRQVARLSLRGHDRNQASAQCAEIAIAALNLPSPTLNARGVVAPYSL